MLNSISFNLFLASAVWLQSSGLVMGQTCSNMLANGSFEGNTVAPGSYTFFAPAQIPGWKSLYNEEIELWGDGLQGAPSPDGKVFLELDAHSSNRDFLYQDIQTIKGQKYEASFLLRARSPAVQSASETAIFSWNDEESSFNAEKTGVWTKISLTVEGTGGLDRFAIRESHEDGANDSLGPLMDDFRLIPAKCGGNSGGGGGDPHFKTWTGVKFDYHGECDLVLLDHPTFANGRGLRVHIRTTRHEYFSYIQRVALQIGDDVLEFADRNNILFNGKDMGTATKFAGYQFNTFKTAVSVRLNDQAKARIDFFARKNGTPYVVVNGGSTTLFEGSLGLIGDWATGQMVGRDGETVFEDADSFGAEWQVRDNEPMLFTTVRAPQYPTVCIPPKKMLGNRLGDSRMRAAAEEKCSAWKEDKDNCIFDVMATRDIRAAENPISFKSASAGDDDDDEEDKPQASIM